MFHTIAAAADALRQHRVSSLELTEAALAAIDARNAATNAFILIDREGARARAAQADDERRRGVDLGLLHGIPISIKDLIDVAGQPTTAGSRVFANNIAVADAPVITQLRAAGAVLVGKTNLHEFALGTTSEDSAFGPVRHPQDPSRVAGGSSGGSAVAVATGMSLASVGTDTGGSIRIPCAVCGVVGLKPSSGDVPMPGIVPLSTTCDHAGPITRTVADARTMWRVLANRSPEAPARHVPSPLRLGRLTGYFGLMEPVVQTAFERALRALASAGAHVDEVEIGAADMIADTYVRIVLPEAANWHARYLDARDSPYSPAVRSRLESGRLIPAVNYLHALEWRATYRRSVDALLELVDALVLPTLPMIAPVLGRDAAIIGGQDVPVRTAMLRNTQLFNITGHPAISLPLDAAGWPCGLQLVGRASDTAGLLGIAEYCEEIIGR